MSIIDTSSAAATPVETEQTSGSVVSSSSSAALAVGVAQAKRRIMVTSVRTMEAV